MFTVHGMSDSGNCYKVKLVLEALGLSYRWVEVDTMGGETRTPAFLAKNPNGKVPVLELEDGTFLPESNAIIFYLAEGTALLPAERLARAPFFAGGAYSIADIALYAYTHCAADGGFDLARYPSVQAWIGRVRSQPRHVPIG